jgi:hypothetical protein
VSKKSTPATQKYAERHLIYEIQMVSGLVARFHTFRELLPTLDPNTANQAEREVLDVVGRNADIEAFATHARVLIDFLYDRKSRNTCVAADFFARRTAWGEIKPKKPKPLRSVRDRTGKEISHLSYGRSDPSPPWDYDAMWDALKGVLRLFVEKADVALLGSENRVRIANLVGTPPAKNSLRYLVPGAHFRTLVGVTEAPPSETAPGPGTAVPMPPPPNITGD